MSPRVWRGESAGGNYMVLVRAQNYGYVDLWTILGRIDLSSVVSAVKLMGHGFEWAVFFQKPAGEIVGENLAAALIDDVDIFIMILHEAGIECYRFRLEGDLLSARQLKEYAQSVEKDPLPELISDSNVIDDSDDQPSREMPFIRTQQGLFAGKQEEELARRLNLGHSLLTSIAVEVCGAWAVLPEELIGFERARQAGAVLDLYKPQTPHGNPSKKASAVIARRTAWAMAARTTIFSLSEIGEAFGGYSEQEVRKHLRQRIPKIMIERIARSISI